MPSLGVPINYDRGKKLSRFQFYLPLSDALYLKAGTLEGDTKALADSFAFDVLNLAALAGRLLWRSGITPEPSMFTRHDILDVTVDAESYFVMLQTACDILAKIIVTIGVEKKGQAPADSFHKFTEWVSRQLRQPNPRLTPDLCKLMSSDMPWFTEINAIRTSLVHRGKSVWIYTEGRGFEWALHGGESKISRGTDLLTSLQKLTLGMLNFSDQLADIIIPGAERRQAREMRIIDGLYVPALRHLLEAYSTPLPSDDLMLTAQCLMSCRGYIEAAFIGYPGGFWWTLLLDLSRQLSHGMRASRVFVRSNGLVSDCRFVLTHESHNFGIVACDVARDSAEWRTGVTESAKRLADDYSTKKTVVVVRWIEEGVKSLTDPSVALVAAAEPLSASKQCLALWNI